jgi:hypothetical protein
MGIWRDRASRDDHNPSGRSRRHRRDDWEDPDNGAARAAERMLAGQAAAMMLQTGGQAPPAWAYLNALAHGTVEDLHDLAGADAARPDSKGWSATTSYLAADMIAYDRDAGHIRQTQREVLVPMELEFLDDRFDPPSTPADFAGLVLRVLERHRTRRSD